MSDDVKTLRWAAEMFNREQPLANEEWANLMHLLCRRTADAIEREEAKQTVRGDLNQEPFTDMSDAELLDAILSWLPDSLLLGSNGATVFHRQEKDGVVRIEFPEDPWCSRVKDNLLVVLLKARARRRGASS